MPPGFGGQLTFRRSESSGQLEMFSAPMIGAAPHVGVAPQPCQQAPQIGVAPKPCQQAPMSGIAPHIGVPPQVGGYSPSQCGGFPGQFGGFGPPQQCPVPQIGVAGGGCGRTHFGENCFDNAGAVTLRACPAMAA